MLAGTTNFRRLDQVEHFWDTVDTIGEGFGFSLFGARHLVTLALYIGFALYMRYATGLVAGNIFRTLSWTVRDNYLRLLFSWIIALLLLTMIACTLYSYRAQVVRWGNRNLALLAAGWLAHLGSRYALGLWLRHIVGSTWVPSLSWPIVLYNTLDSINDFAAVALLVLTVALWRGWRQSRSKTK